MARPNPVPQNLDAERALLGAIFLDNDALFDVSAVIVKGDFYEPANGEIFAILKDHIEAGRVATPSTALHDLSQDADIGGIAASEYLHRLRSQGVPRASVSTVARTIADTSLARRAIALSDEFSQAMRFKPGTVSAEEIRDKYDAIFGALFASTEDIGIVPISTYGERLVDQINDALRQEKSIGIPMALKCVQDLTGPLMPTNVYVMAGPPGSGKSALVEQILRDISRRQGRHVLFCSAEMPGAQVAGRALVADTGIASGRIRRANLTDMEFERLIEASKKLDKEPFYVDARKNPTVAAIGTRARRMKRLIGLDALAIDHLLYLAAPVRGMSIVEAIQPNMQEIKALADDLGVPIIVLAQLKGKFNAGPVRRPQVDDLWNDSAVEQNADVIFFPHRPEYLYGRREPDRMTDEAAHREWSVNMEHWRGRAEIVLGKNRDDAGFGVRSCFFDPVRMHFSDGEPRAEAESFDFMAPA